MQSISRGKGCRAGWYCRSPCVSWLYGARCPGDERPESPRRVRTGSALRRSHGSLKADFSPSGPGETASGGECEGDHMPPPSGLPRSYRRGLRLRIGMRAPRTGPHPAGITRDQPPARRAGPRMPTPPTATSADRIPSTCTSARPVAPPCPPARQPPSPVPAVPRPQQPAVTAPSARCRSRAWPRRRTALPAALHRWQPRTESVDRQELTGKLGLPGPTSARCRANPSERRGKAVRTRSNPCVPVPTGGCGERRRHRATEAVPPQPPAAPAHVPVHPDGTRANRRRVWPHSCPDDRAHATPCRLPSHTGPALPRIQPTSALLDGGATRNPGQQGREGLATPRHAVCQAGDGPGPGPRP